MTGRRQFLEKAAAGTVAFGLLAASRGSEAVADTAAVPLVLRGPEGYTGNLQEWRAPDDELVASVSAGGAFRRHVPGARAPFVWDTAMHVFQDSASDPVSLFGYNSRASGGPLVAGEPTAAYVIEADYDDGAVRTMEMYLEAYDETHTIGMRPLFFRFRRAAADRSSFLANAFIAGPLSVLAADGAEIATFRRHAVTVHAPDGRSNTLYVHRAPGHSANLALGDEGGDAFALHAHSNRSAASMTLRGRTIMRLSSSPLGAPGASISVGGVDDASAVGVFDVGASNRQVKGLVARGRSSQAGSLQEWQDAERRPLLAVTPQGQLRFGADAAATLARPRPGTLATTGRLAAGAGLAVGNAVPAESREPGTLAHWVEIFDEAGASLGHLPVHRD